MYFAVVTDVSHKGFIMISDLYGIVPMPILLFNIVVHNTVTTAVRIDYRFTKYFVEHVYLMKSHCPSFQRYTIIALYGFFSVNNYGQYYQVVLQAYHSWWYEQLFALNIQIAIFTFNDLLCLAVYAWHVFSSVHISSWPFARSLARSFAYFKIKISTWLWQTSAAQKHPPPPPHWKYEQSPWQKVFPYRIQATRNVCAINNGHVWRHLWKSVYDVWHMKEYSTNEYKKIGSPRASILEISSTILMVGIW